MINNRQLNSLFYLDPKITFLNFGSFGACPKPVFEDYQKWQLELETEPVQFMTVNGLNYLKQSRDALGKYIGCNGTDLVYFANPSFAVNTVARSLNLKASDEILTTNIEYGACDKAWQYYCDKSGAKYIRKPITLPLKNKEQFIEEFFKGLSHKTKLVFISQITSSTALILPVKEICEIAKSKGLMTFIDGAHVPGHIDLDISKLEVDFYTGACHKWMLTPKGCSFLYCQPELQNQLDPLVISWGYKSAFPSHSQFLDYHQMQGTRDFSAFLTVPKAIAFMNENNWGDVSLHCKQLVRENALRFCKLLNTHPLCPITDEFLGQMFSIPVICKEPEQLQKHLFTNYQIEIPVMRLDDKVFVRYSINAFNSQNDLDKLYAALEEIKTKTGLIG
jgi:isopenicillin-N epimerase